MVRAVAVYRSVMKVGGERDEIIILAYRGKQGRLVSKIKCHGVNVSRKYAVAIYRVEKNEEKVAT